MEINLLSGATYSPVRIPAGHRTPIEPKAGAKPNAARPPIENSLMPKLSLDELNEIQKHFGDLKLSDKKELLNSARPGMFIDITA